MQTVTIATFNRNEPAQLVKLRLVDAGIPAEVKNQTLLQRVWFLSETYSAFHLVVPKEFFESASQLLELWHDQGGLMKDALRCPECGSLRIEYPQMTRKFVLPTLVAHLLIFFGLMNREFYCEECHHTWHWPAKTGTKSIHRERSVGT